MVFKREYFLVASLVNSFLTRKLDFTRLRWINLVTGVGNLEPLCLYMSCSF